MWWFSDGQFADPDDCQCFYECSNLVPFRICCSYSELSPLDTCPVPRVCRRHALQRQPARVRLPRARGLRQQATARAEDNNYKEAYNYNNYNYNYNYNNLGGHLLDVRVGWGVSSGRGEHSGQHDHGGCRQLSGTTSSSSSSSLSSSWQEYCRSLEGCHYFTWYQPMLHCYLLAQCAATEACECCIRWQYFRLDIFLKIFYSGPEFPDVDVATCQLGC